MGGLTIPLMAATDEKTTNYLLITQADIDAVLAKAKRCAWAGDALKDLFVAHHRNFH